ILAAIAFLIVGLWESRAALEDRRNVASEEIMRDVRINARRDLLKDLRPKIMMYSSNLETHQIAGYANDKAAYMELVRTAHEINASLREFGDYGTPGAPSASQAHILESLVGF